MNSRAQHPPVPRYLLRGIPLMAAGRQWGGGLHRSHLAELMHVQPDDRAFIAALWILRRQGWIDLWRGWVIADRPRRPAARTREES